MDRKYWKDRLDAITAFANGETITNADGTPYGPSLDFDLPAECYRIAKPKERVPLEAEDWIKDGPWWYRSNENDVVLKLVSSVGPMSIGRNNSGCTYEQLMNGQRRNATSDWMPCWKEKE